jgi:hypothetical protein
MNDALKANLQSVIRAVINLYAGTHVLAPGTADKVEGWTLTAIAVVWTLLDNIKKTKPTEEKK